MPALWRSERSFKRNELISVTASPSSAFLKTVGQNIYKEHSAAFHASTEKVKDTPNQPPHFLFGVSLLPFFV